MSGAEASNRDDIHAVFPAVRIVSDASQYHSERWLLQIVHVNNPGQIQQIICALKNQFLPAEFDLDQPVGTVRG